MTEFEKPEWKYVVLVGLALFLAIVIIVAVGSYLQDQDELEFCHNQSGVVKYPVCERNSWKFCHGKSNATIFLDCGV